MSLNRIDDRFCVTGQIRPEQVEDLAAQGFKAIVCARPDNEDAGQPAFARIAEAAERQGLKAIHIPLSGAPSPQSVARLREALKGVDGPVLGYCRSGARAANLYAAAR
jgi:uncharacterized protein (TIGR01244 family)